MLNRSQQHVGGTNHGLWGWRTSLWYQ